MNVETSKTGVWLNVEDCIAAGHLQRIPANEGYAAKEWRECGNDFREAKDRLKAKRFKWSTISAYYAMFHAAKALLFKLGFREKAHYAIGVVLEDLVKKGKLESKYANDFRAAMSVRESADYRYVYSEETANNLVEIAGDFIAEIKRLYAAIG